MKFYFWYKSHISVIFMFQESVSGSVPHFQYSLNTNLHGLILVWSGRFSMKIAEYY